MKNDCKIVSIFNKGVLTECLNKLQRRYNLETDSRRKKAIQKRIGLFSKRLAEIEEVLSKGRINRK